MKTRLTRRNFDYLLLIYILILLGIGVLMCASASFVRSSYQGENSTAWGLMKSQFFATAAGIAIMIALSFVDYHIYKLFAGYVLIGAALLNIFTAIFGKSLNGARRWIAIPKLGSFQPSELAKIAIMLFLAALFSDEKFGEKSRGWWGIITFGVPIALTAGSVIIQKHTSATVIVLAIALVILIFARLKPYLWAVAGIVLAAVIIVAVVFLGDSLFSHVGKRLEVYQNTYLGIVNPDAITEENEASFDQIQNSLWAIGSGGFFGKGYAKGVQKYAYLPECYNDFIFAIVAEELGFVGVAGILILFALLIMRGYRASSFAKDRFGMLLGVGIVTMVAVQTVLNICVVSCLIPVTGVSLPFFSYGGTAMIIMLGAMGVLLNIAKQGNYNKLKF